MRQRKIKLFTADIPFSHLMIIMANVTGETVRKINKKKEWDKVFCEYVRRHNLTFQIQNLFSNYDTATGTNFLRMLRKSGVKFKFQETSEIEIDKKALLRISPPLYDYFFGNQ